MSAPSAKVFQLFQPMAITRARAAPGGTAGSCRPPRDTCARSAAARRLGFAPRRQSMRETADRPSRVGQPARRSATSMKLSVRLFLLVVIAALPIFAMQVHGLLEERAQRKAAIAEQALALARLAAAQQDQFIEGARYLLGGGRPAAGRAQRPRAGGMQRAAGRDPAAVPDDFRPRRGRPGGRPVLLRPAGATCASTSPIATISSARCSEKALAISGFVLGRRSGEPQLNFAYPALDEQGEVSAVVILTYQPRGAVGVVVGHAAAGRRHDQPGRRQRRPARPRPAGARLDRPARARGRVHPHHAGPARGRDGGRRHRWRGAPARLRAAARLGGPVRGRRAALAGRVPRGRPAVLAQRRS